jgi:hypothetical protein
MMQRRPGQTQPLGASVPGYGGVNPGMQSVIDSRTGGMQVPAPDQGWSGDNAAQQPYLAGQAGGGFPPRDLGDLHGMLGGGPAMQPQQQQRPGGMYGGGGGAQPMSGYGGNAYGAQMGGYGGVSQRPWSAGGQGNPGNFTTATMYPGESGYPGGGFGSFGGGGGPRDFGQSSYAGPVQQQRAPQAGYGGSGSFGGAVRGPMNPTGYGGGAGVPMGAGGVAYPNYNPAQYPAGRPY